ncbi:Flp pilus assembly protein TadD [Chthoniobacter flavus]|uniref:hypothetical protein n=1 Tax=Chthoniobacter flavus TaxID=191863 RepID=UPI0005B29086|nr:hypothetical protein [Chthoniobacter flavus]TCO92269.1 Flp pilus assembly protein TadD [Chthoniobacter flavus]
MVDLAKKSNLPRNLLITAAALILIAAASYGGWRAYRKWVPPHLAKRARALMQKGDVINASITIRQAFSINPGDLATNRLAAEVCEEKGASEAVVWRRRLVDLQPGILQPALDCAETSLRFGKPAVAREALEKLAAAGQNDARYHEALGRTLAAMGEHTRAVEELGAAVRLEPQNETYQLEQAAALVDRGWIEDRPTAQATLKRISAKPELRLRAFRALVRDAMGNNELSGAVILARQLASLPDAQLADQMTLLDLLRATDTPDFPSFLASMKDRARGNAPATAELLNWMNRNSRFGAAVEWAAEFPPEAWDDPRVCAAAALNIFGLRSWAALESFTETGNWQRLEYVRHALLSRALREEGSVSQSAPQWDAAVASAAKVPGATAELTRMVANWGWEAQYTDLLRALLKDPKESAWASQTILPILSRTKDTAGLLDATARYRETHQGNDAAANNFALYSLLLGRDVAHASELARTLYERHPYEADYVSTYAFSLHRLGQSERALQVMKCLSPAILKTPNFAAYYGVLLAATADWDRAPAFLELAKKADLLPEEQALLRTAREEIQTARSEPE